MSIPIQRQTGVINLNYQQKLALEHWLNENFEIREHPEPAKKKETLYLSQNINNGRQLELSDGSLWEVFPEDTNKASFWITPFPLEVLTTEPVDNAEYPQQILNSYTGVTVKVKQIKEPNPIQPQGMH
jgi:hypothetical protein